MPLLTRLFIKTSLVYLVLALLAGIATALQSAVNLPVPELYPVYLHLFVVGWLSSMIFGVVFWMFPKYTRERPRRSDALAWITFALINAGLILRAIGEPLNAARPGTFWGWALVISALLLWGAGALFIFNTWGRVKER